MTTNAFAAKRALFRRLTQLAADQAGPIGGWQVEYAWPGLSAASDRLVYGGRVTFDQPADREMESGHQRVVGEVAHLWWHIRRKAGYAELPGGVEATDVEVETVGEELGRLLLAEPYIGGGHSITRVASGAGDYSATDNEATSILTYQVDVASHFDPAAVDPSAV